MKKPLDALSLHLRHRLANWLLRDVRLDQIRARDAKFGDNTITLHGGGVDLVRWSATQAPLALGDLGMDNATGRAQGFIDGVASSYATTSQAFTVETGAGMYLDPMPRTGAQSSRVSQATLEGAAFWVHLPVQFNRVQCRLTAASVGVGTVLRVLLYQASGGGSGTANLKATCTFPVAAAGAQNIEMTPTEGTVTMAPGWCFGLFGLSAGTGSATVRTHGLTSYDNLTANMQATAFALSFTTASASSTSPASFDPVADFTAAGGTDLAAVIRLRKV